MKRWLLSILILLTSCVSIYSQNQPPDYDTNQFRESRNKDFKNPDLSPLLSQDLANFKELDFFAFDANYRIKAVFEKTVEKKYFLMPTTQGESRKYLKIGDFSFKLNGIDHTLGAYFYEFPPDHPRAKEEIRDVFVPFKDLTNGKETYSAGRYLYVRLPKEGTETIIDFNLTYNPSCAYGNERFSCTLPPKENFLQVEIKAGEKKFVSLNEKSTH
ncbi:MAG: DUF1684 domain-containing protein [Pyrinomonadaceae bacterium]|nr:DUF1684 domain-containing protein [Pyrinomonadaceae bacterium]